MQMGEDYHNRGKRGEWGQMPDRPMFGGSGGRFCGRGRFEHPAGPPRDLGSDRPPRSYFGPGRGQAFPPSSRREGLDRGPGMYPPGMSDWQRPPPPGPLGPDAWQHSRGSRDAAAVAGRDLGFASRVPSPQDSYSRDWDAEKTADMFGRERELRDRERDRSRRPGIAGTGGERGSSTLSRSNTAPAFAAREPDRAVPTWSSRAGARDSQQALAGRGERDWATTGGFTSPERVERMAGDAHGPARSAAAALAGGADARDSRYGPVDKAKANLSKGSADKEFGPRGGKEYASNDNSKSGKGDRAASQRDNREANQGHKRGDAQRSTSSTRHGLQGPISGSSDMWSDKEGRDGSSGRRSADKEGREGSSGGRHRSDRDRKVAGKDRQPSRDRAGAADADAAEGVGGVTQSRSTYAAPPAAAGSDRSQGQSGDVQHHSSRTREHRKSGRERDRGKERGSSSRSRHGSKSRSGRHAAEQQQESGARDQHAAEIKPQEEQQSQLAVVGARQQHTESEDMEAGEVLPSEEPLDQADKCLHQQQQSGSEIAAGPQEHGADGWLLSCNEVSAGSDDHLYSPPTEEEDASLNPADVAEPPATALHSDLPTIDDAPARQLSTGELAPEAGVVISGPAAVNTTVLSATGHDVDVAGLAQESPQSPTGPADDNEQMEVDSSAEADAAAGAAVQDTAGVSGVHAAAVRQIEAATDMDFAPTDIYANQQQLHSLSAAQMSGSMLLQQHPPHAAETMAVSDAAAAPSEDGPAPKRRRLGFGVSLARLGKGGSAAAAVATDDTAAVDAPAHYTEETHQPTESEVNATASAFACETASSVEHVQPVPCADTAVDDEAASSLPTGVSEQLVAEDEQQQQIQQEQQQLNGEQLGDVQPESVPVAGQPSKAEITRALQQLEDETGQLEQQLKELSTTTDALTTLLASLDQELAQTSARDLWPAAKQHLAAALQEQQRLEQEQRELLQQQEDDQQRLQQQQQELQQIAASTAADAEVSSAMQQLECHEPPLVAPTDSADECLQPLTAVSGEVSNKPHWPGHHTGAYTASAFGSSRLQGYLWNLPPAVASRQQAVLQQNKQIAATARTDLVRLLPEELHQEAQSKLSAAQPLEKCYDTIQDLQEVWEQLMKQRDEDGGAVARFLAQRRALLKLKHDLQVQRYKEHMIQFQGYLKTEQEAATAAAAAAAAAAPAAGNAWGPGRQLSGNLGGGRSTRAAAGAAAASHTPYQPDVIRTTYAEERVMELFRAVEELKHMSVLPQQLQDPWQRRWQGFASNNALVVDPVKEQQEDKMGLDWSEEERKIFMDRFLQFPKDFRKISDYLEHRTPAECVVFFYKHQKLDEFAHVRRKQQLKKRRQTAETKRLWASSMRPMAMNAMREAAEQREQRRENRERERENREREAAAAAAAAAPWTATSDRAAVSWGYNAFSTAAVGASSRTGRGGRSRSRAGRGRTRGAATAVATGSAAGVDYDGDDDYNPYDDPAMLAGPGVGLGARRLSSEDGAACEFTAGPVPDDVFMQAVLLHGRNMAAISSFVTTAGYPKTASYCKWFYSRQKRRLNLDDVAERCLAERRAAREAAVAATAAEEEEEEVVDYAAAAAAMQGYLPGDPAAMAAALQQQYAGFMNAGVTGTAAVNALDGFRVKHSASVTGLDQMMHNAPAVAASLMPPAAAGGVGGVSEAPSASGFGDGGNEHADDGATSSAAAAAAGAGARRSSSAWSDAERELFLLHFSQEGKNWIRLAQLIPSKSHTQIKSYYSNNRRKLDLDSLLPAGPAAVSRGSRGRSRANSVMMGELVTPQQQQLLQGPGGAGEQMDEASRIMMAAAAVAAAQDAANAHGHAWQPLPGSHEVAGASEAAVSAGGGVGLHVGAGSPAAALLALLQEGRMLPGQGTADSGAASLGAAVASSAGLSSLTGHPSALLGALQLTNLQQPGAPAAAAELVSRLAHTHTEQQQHVLAQALFQLQAVASDSQAPVMSLLGNALSQAPAAAAGTALAGFPEQLALLSQLAQLPNASAAAGMVVEQRPYAAAAGPAGVKEDIAQLLAAHMGMTAADTTAAAGSDEVAGQLLAHLAAAAQAQYQHQQQHVLQQLLSDRGHGQNSTALLSHAQQQELYQNPAAQILAAVTAAAAAAQEPTPQGEHASHQDAVAHAAAVAVAEEVDPLQALRQTLSTLKADLGIDAETPAIATSAQADVHNEQPAAKRHKANPSLHATADATAASGADAAFLGEAPAADAEAAVVGDEEGNAVEGAAAEE